MRAHRVVWVQLAAFVALGGALVHVGAIIGGPSWFAFFGAPPRVVASAQAGTWLAPVSALVIAGLMAMCAIYAGSVVGWVRRPPLQRTALATIAAVCLLRALILPAIAFSQPDFRCACEVASAVVWWLAGAGFVAAFRLSGARASPARADAREPARAGLVRQRPRRSTRPSGRPGRFA